MLLGAVAVLGVAIPTAAVASRVVWTDTQLCTGCDGDPAWDGPVAAVAGNGGSTVGAATFFGPGGIRGARIAPLPGVVSPALIAYRRLPFLLLTVSSIGEACAGSGPFDETPDPARWIVSCRPEESASWLESARLAPGAIVDEEFRSTGPAMAFLPGSDRLIVTWISTSGLQESVWVASRDSSHVWGDPVRVGGPFGFGVIGNLQLRVPSRGPSAVVAWTGPSSPGGADAAVSVSEVNGVWSAPSPVPSTLRLAEDLDLALAKSGALFASTQSAPVRTEGKVAEVTIRSVGGAQRLRLSTGDGHAIPFRGPKSWTVGVGVGGPWLVSAGPAKATFAIWTSKRRVRLALVTLNKVQACDDLPLVVDYPPPLSAAQTAKELLLLIGRGNQLHLSRTSTASLITKCRAARAR